MNEINDLISKLKTTQTRLHAHTPSPMRPTFEKLDKETGRAIMLTGPRGTGKTTYLLKRSAQDNLLYFSADNPLISSLSLYSLVEAAFMDGYKGVMIDEIHYAKDWSRHVKSIYDSFPDNIIWISDSSTIVLRKGVADLSRRFISRRLPLLSLREYSILRGEDNKLPVLDPFALNKTDVNHILKNTPVLKLHREWLDHGFRPIFLEDPAAYSEKLLSVIEKTIAMDIPYLVPQLTQGHLRFMTGVIGHLAKSNIPTLAVNSLCNEWGIGKEKLYNLLDAMENAQLIRVVRKKNDHSLQSIGAKIFLHDPSAYAAIQGDTGCVREAATVAAFQEAGRNILAAHDEREYDFVIDGKLTVEVGGKSKKAKKAAFVIRDHTDIPTGNVIPLWVLGFMY